MNGAEIEKGKPKGRLGSARLEAGARGSSLTVWHSSGPAVKVSADEAAWDSKPSASVEVSPASVELGPDQYRTEPDRFDTVRYARLHGDGLEVHDTSRRATISSGAVSLSDLETHTLKEGMARLGIESPKFPKNMPVVPQNLIRADSLVVSMGWG